MNILITSAGKRVSLIKSFKNELGKISSKGIVFASDAYPEKSAACNFSEKSFKTPLINEENFISSLLENCIKKNIKLLVPTIDTELYLLSKNKEKFLDSGIRIVISSSNLIKKLQNKRLTNAFFEDKNICTAKIYNKDAYRFPIYIKPISGSRSINNYLIYNEGEIQRKFLEDDSLIFFEYIDQNENDEYTCDLYYGKDSRLKCVVPRKRIEVRDGEVEKGITKKNNLVEFISKRLNHIDGARGCLTSQFFLNKKTDKIIGIEINPRFGGGYPLTYASGANFSKWILEEYLLNKKINTFNDWEENILMLRYSKELYVHT